MLERGSHPYHIGELQNILDFPPYMHDGRLLTIEDRVEFFNPIQQRKLMDREKAALVAFMRAL